MKIRNYFVVLLEKVEKISRSLRSLGYTDILVRKEMYNCADKSYNVQQIRKLFAVLQYKTKKILARSAR